MNVASSTIGIGGIHSTATLRDLLREQVSSILSAPARQFFNAWTESNLQSTVSAKAIRSPDDARVQGVRGTSGSVLFRAKPGLPQLLFDANAQAKQHVSRVWMHIPAENRQKLFARIDDLLNFEDWHEDSSIPLEGSFATFVYFLILMGQVRWPAIGLGEDGLFVGTWTDKVSRLTVIFLPRQRVRWVFSQVVDGDRTSLAGEHSLMQLPQNLSPDAMRMLNDR